VILSVDDAADLHALQTAAYAQVHAEQDDQRRMPVLEQAVQTVVELESRVPEHVREVKIFTGEDTATGYHFYTKLGYPLAGHEYLESGVGIVQLRKKVAARTA